MTLLSVENVSLGSLDKSIRQALQEKTRLLRRLKFACYDGFSRHYEPFQQFQNTRNFAFRQF